MRPVLFDRNFEFLPDAERDERERRYRRDLLLLGFSVALSLPLLFQMTSFLPWSSGAWELPRWWQFALATPIQFIVGSRFYRGGAGNPLRRIAGLFHAFDESIDRHDARLKANERSLAR